MKKIHIIGILIGLTIALLLLPTVYAVGLIFVSPSGEIYIRGDILDIEVVTYTSDDHAYLQIQRGSTIVWVDQEIGGFSPNFQYILVIPNNWSGGTYTINVKGDIGSVGSTMLYLYVPSGGGYTPPPSANFVLSDFTISPTTVDPDETVKISVKVTNTGTKSGTKTVKLTIDGIVEGSKDVALGIQESDTVSWNVKRATLGTYSVEVNGLIGSFNVETEEGPEPGLPESDEFILSNLVVSPSTVEPGETVTISVTVTNVGEEAGSYTAELLVDSSKVDEDTVALVGGASETVEFTGVSGEEGTQRCPLATCPATSVEMPEEGVGLNWALYAVGGLVILGIAWVVYKQFLES